MCLCQRHVQRNFSGVSNTSTVLEFFKRVCKDAVNKTISGQLSVWKVIGHSNLRLLWQSCSALISSMTLRVWSDIHSCSTKVTLIEGWKRGNFCFTAVLQPFLFLSIQYKAACLHLISKEMVREERNWAFIWVADPSVCSKPKLGSQARALNVVAFGVRSCWECHGSGEETLFNLKCLNTH